MSYFAPAERKGADWIHTKQPPPEGFSSRLYEDTFESRYGVKDAWGVTRYRLNCSYWFGDWIEENGSDEQWEPYGAPHRAIYIVREDLMAFIKLKWL